MNQQIRMAILAWALLALAIVSIFNSMTQRGRLAEYRTEIESLYVLILDSHYRMFACEVNVIQGTRSMREAMNLLPEKGGCLWVRPGTQIMDAPIVVLTQTSVRGQISILIPVTEGAPIIFPITTQNSVVSGLSFDMMPTELEE